MNSGTSTPPSETQLLDLNQRHENQTPQEILTYALSQYFPGIILACSFGAEDVVLVDMMCRINPQAPLLARKSVV